MRRSAWRWCQTRRGPYTLTKLPSGLRVISCDDGSGITGLSLFTSNAPCNESTGTYGSSAIAECLPLSGNEHHTAQQIASFFERVGNSFKMINVKECLGYIALVPRYHAQEALEILAGMALHPTKDINIFETAKQSVLESAEFFERDATRVCFEQVFRAGWNGKGAGVPQIPAPETLQHLTQEKFLSFHHTFTRPETSVVAATGIADHNQFVQHVEKALDFPPLLSIPSMEETRYVGGAILTHKLEAPDSTRKFAEKTLTHMAICVPTVSVRHPDYYTYSTLQTLLGGGTSFSSGGPGKGLHTKLFREVINREGWIHGIECITGWFRCGGLLGLYGQSPHEWNLQLHQCILRQLASMSQRVTASQLQMAKNQLMSQLILLGETRDILLEELGKNVLLHNHVLISEELQEGTTRVTLDDIHRACRNAIVGQPISYSVLGNTERLPSKEQTEEMLPTLFRRMNEDF